MPAHLFMRSGPNSGEIHSLSKNAVLVGRGDECDIRLGDLHSSRTHLRIERRGESYWAVDLQSRNGTAVNGLPVSEKQLASGDEVRVATTCMVFVLSREPALAKAGGASGKTSLEFISTQVLKIAGSQRFDMIGACPAMQKVFSVIEKVAPLDVTILVTGESGTGKELVARALHNPSPRSAGPLVSVNCAAIPHGLAESELFGHERGAFTGAHVQRQGKFALASGGTLFLDEIGELPLESEAKLLRVLEEKKVTPVGAKEPVDLDVRLVAASNRDLRALAEAGKFRQDLLYRLEVVRIDMPALRDRKGDIPKLVSFFLNLYCAKTGRGELSVAPEALVPLEAYSWPGNVRELKNVIERAVILAPGPRLGPADILLPGTPAGAGKSVEQPPASAVSLAEVERRHILGVLQLVGGNKAEAALILGISRSTLFAKLKDFGQDTAEFSPVAKL